MSLDTETLKSLLAASTPGPWQIANHGTWEVEAPPNQLIADCGTVDCARGDAKLIALAPELAAEVIRLREECETGAALVLELQAERDEARAEVERLRELVNPTTPAGKLSAYRAAQEITWAPLKAAHAWVAGKNHHYRESVNGTIVEHRDGKYALFLEEDDPPTWVAGTKADADAALIAAGWELVGGPS